MSMDINSNYINYTSQTNYKNQTDKTKDNEEKQKHISAKDYEKNLFEKFEYLGKQTSMEGVPVNVSVSPAYIRKCANDPEQAKYLEENLKDIPNSVKSLCDYVKCATGGAVVTFANISIDANGNITCQSGSTNDPDGKIAKENAERKAKEQKAKKAEKSKIYTMQSDKDKVQDYYEKLCKKFPQINFNKEGGVLPCNSNKVTVNLSKDCLKKMANDPEFAKEIEWNLSGEVAANSMVYGWAQRDGVVLGGRTVTYDANGNRKSSCGGMRTANVVNGNNTNKIQNKYKEEEERWQKARKKRAEKEKLEKKKAEEKEAEKRAEKKENNENYTFNITVKGTDIKTLTKQIISNFSSISTGTSKLTSVDVKV